MEIRRKIPPSLYAPMRPWEIEAQLRQGYMPACFVRRMRVINILSAVALGKIEERLLSPFDVMDLHHILDRQISQDAIIDQIRNEPLSYALATGDIVPLWEAAGRLPRLRRSFITGWASRFLIAPFDPICVMLAMKMKTLLDLVDEMGHSFNLQRFFPGEIEDPIPEPPEPPTPPGPEPPTPPGPEPPTPPGPEPPTPPGPEPPTPPAPTPPAPTPPAPTPPAPTPPAPPVPTPPAPAAPATTPWRAPEIRVIGLPSAGPGEGGAILPRPPATTPGMWGWRWAVDGEETEASPAPWRASGREPIPAPATGAPEIAGRELRTFDEIMFGREPITEPWIPAGMNPGETGDGGGPEGSAPWGLVIGAATIGGPVVPGGHTAPPPGETWTSYFDNTCWQNFGGFTWNGVSWDMVSGEGYLEAIGTWFEGYRPTAYRVTFTSAAGTRYVFLMATGWTEDCVQPYVSETIIPITTDNHDLTHMGFVWNADLQITNIEFRG